jgi:hypothetical protein
MLITTNIESINGVWHAMVFTSQATEAEWKAINMFGEPAVDVGGSFSGTLTRPNTSTPITVAYSFTSPTLRRILTDFPVKQIFYTSASANADVEAQLYAQTIQARITSAIAALLAQSNSFGGSRQLST